jgi:hypothetical protein
MTTRSTRLTALTVATGLAALTTLAACGNERQRESPPQAAPITTAVAELQCTGPVFAKGRGDYEDSGLERVRDTPEAAWANLVSENDPGLVPHRLRAVAITEDRALLTLSAGERRTVAAAVATNGMTDWDGGTGWGIEQWAVCDPSELPAAVTDDWWLQVWHREDGSRVPTSQVSSYDGPAHCDWQDVRFLELGDRTYLRDPEGKLADLSQGRFDASTALPDSARDSGFRRDGWALWTVPGGDAVYLVGQGGVEKWPGARQVGCA